MLIGDVSYLDENLSAPVLSNREPLAVGDVLTVRAADFGDSPAGKPEPVQQKLAEVLASQCPPAKRARQ